MPILRVKDENGKWVEIPAVGGGGGSGGQYPSVKDYKEDTDPDDTLSFQRALAENRVVMAPGGEYTLSNTLVIRENCCLELSQDTVLKFTQTAGNCIEMRGSAVLRGNHAVISAAYGLTGNVISMDTSQDGVPHNSIPPYAQNDPQWKRGRFVYDVNIIKPNASGYNRPSGNDPCSGTAIYMHCDGMASIPFMWGITMSGIRIVGGFSYGIRAYNVDNPDKDPDNAWNHDMRIEAVIEGCEIGVSLENCNGAHLNVTIQPTTSNPGGVKYVKQGFVLRDSRFVDMLRSRVWDWHVARSDSAEYKHIALYGNCRGLLLDDFLVTEHSGVDIRDEIYTDTPSNFDTMTILQEPANKWFNSIDNKPYFNNGNANSRLMLATDKFTAEQMEFITPADGYYTYEDAFTNLVDAFTDGVYLASGGATASLAGYVTTDFIPIDGAAEHTYRIGGEGIIWKDSYNYGRIAWYDADKNLKGSVMPWKNIDSNQNSANYPKWVEDEMVNAAFITSATVSAPNGAAFFRVSASGKGENLKITIDEKQEQKAIWHGEPKRLDDSIKVKAENVIGGSGGGVTSWNDLTDKPFGESDNAVLLPSTQFIGGLMEGALVALDASVELAEGKTYTVNWNGVDYEAECFMGQSPLDGEPIPVVGNPVALGGENNNLPFVIGGNAEGLAAIPLDGSTSANVSIKGYGIVPVPIQYLTNALPYYVQMVNIGGSGSVVYSTTERVSNLTAVLNSGRDVKIRYIDGDSIYIGSIMGYTADAKPIITFTVSVAWVRFTPQEDGTYTITQVM